MTLAQLIIHAAGLIKGVVSALADASEERISPDEALARMQALGNSLAAVNARVDAAADEKFGPKTSEEDEE